MKKKSLQKELKAIAQQLQEIRLVLEKGEKPTVVGNSPKGAKDNRSENRKYIIDDEPLLNNQEACNILQISGRSLQRYRISGKLMYYILGGSAYYKVSDVQQFMKQRYSHNKEDCPPSTL
ncbi:helix-turn-helix domain-containing protein [Chryseobacterium sp. 22543]|uniref:helix-turn-helix domain-containing protein n=1 Tax=Chryseobacterium sp. 22543 TaxID=3453940 RepID=UPI003F836148